MEKIMSWNLILILLLFTFVSVNSKYLEGYLKTLEDWHFLARFCFLSEKGRLQFEFLYPQANYEPQNILLYFDEPDQWPAVYNSDKNCFQREAVLNQNPQNNQIIYLTLSYSSAGCQITSEKDSPNTFYYNCSQKRTFLSARERWWYVAASHCGTVYNCTTKTSPPHIKPENNQEIMLQPGRSRQLRGSGCQWTNIDGEDKIYCKEGRSFVSARERWWFITVSRCVAKNNVVGIDLHYKLWLTNGDENEFFFYHFSADEFYILQVDIAFLLAMVGLLVLSIVFAVKLSKQQLFHTTYKMYILALVCEVFHLLFMCIAYGKYANDGLDNYGLKTTGRVFEAIGVLIFLLMLILMAKGFTITRGRISTSGSIKVAVFMTLLSITYAVLFIYEAAIFDPGEVLYLYESPPGYGLVAMRLIGWIWFCYATFFTLKHYPEKASFYYPFFIFYTLWFWAAPFWILLSNFAVAKWVRETVVSGVLNFISFCGFSFFLILTRPSAANRNFPYHVRTSQIGIMVSAPHTGTDQGGAALEAQNSPRGSRTHGRDMGTIQDGAPNLLALFNTSNTRSEKYLKDENGTALNNAQSGSTQYVEDKQNFPHQRENPFVTQR